MSESRLDPADLPGTWVLTTLGTAVNYGKTDKAEPSEMQADDWILELEDIEKGSSRLLQRLTFSDRQSRSTKSRFQTGDVLYGKLRPYLNKVLIADRPGYCTTEIVPIEAGLHLDARYVFYWLKHPAFLEYVEAQSHGMNMPRLGTDSGKAAPFVLAPHREQMRIADQLDALLGRVNACNDRLDIIADLLSRFRQMVLEAATSGGLTYEWRVSNPDVLSPDDVIRARLATIVGEKSKNAFETFCTAHPPSKSYGQTPATWVATHVGMVGLVSNGSTPSRKEPSYWNGSIPWVSSGEVNNTVITSTREAITAHGVSNSSVRILPPGTILMAMIGEGKTRGQSALLGLPACINQNIAGVIPVDELLNSRYLWYWFQSQYEMTRTKGNGSGPKALNCERVRELEVQLPPKSEQAEIVRRVEALFALADRIEARCTAARTHAQRLAPHLLAKAFRGELVPQDPNDEPASELLARIAAERALGTTIPKIGPARKPRAVRSAKETVAMTKSHQDAD